MMNRAVIVGGALLVLSACGGADIEQKVTTLEAGQAYTIDTLVIAEEGVTASITQDEIIIDELGTYPVKFTIEKQGKETTKSFKYEVVDHTAPSIKLIKDAVIVQGEAFNLADYIQITDNVKSNLIEQVQVEPAIDTNIIGKQEVTLTVKDSSGNEATEYLDVTIVEPRTELQVGNTISVVTQYNNNEVKFDFTPNKMYFTDKIVPSNPDGFYSYYEAEAGKDYFVLEATVSNTGGNTFGTSVFDPTYLDYNSALKYSIVFNNEFTFEMYNGNIDKLTDDQIDSYPSIDPFESHTWIFKIELPENVKDMAYELNLSIGEKQYFIKSN